MSDWKLLNKARVPPSRDSVYGSEPSDGFNGFFCLVLNGLKIKVIASDQKGWQHVSVSINDSTNTPSWSIMCQVKDLFWEDEDWVVQFHPAKSEYVNQHPGVLHLWKCTHSDNSFPTPDRLMVGVRDKTDMEKINALTDCPIKFKI